ncbi:alpha/beta fold hydrolase [Nocardia sp. NBC_01327]|uniref:alpha/beta fold hydrolase n=1 Tax=Nocardia sp. NBC_01327 TaxID=2903593 RepID=UPI002E116EA2|nr:alpha/beta hydrolase [Nocardia sp. NBC_01327]
MSKATVTRTPAITSVQAPDGTRIGYRQIGTGPGLVLVHGAMMASKNFETLADLLAADFTVYVPDRRGRGMSGPFGPNYGIRTEIDDLAALLEETGAHYVFGLSAGATVALHAARALPQITKLALYDAPLADAEGKSPLGWLDRFEHEMNYGKTATAFVTVLKGTGDIGGVAKLPRVMLTPVIALMLRLNKGTEDDPSMRDLLPTVRYDVGMVESVVADKDFSGLRCDTLLLGGETSIGYLQDASQTLEKLLPDVRRVTLPGVGHMAALNDEKPELVAAELRSFFR